MKRFSVFVIMFLIFSSSIGSLAVTSTKIPSVKVSITSLTKSLDIGSTTQLSAVGGEVKWSSSDSSIATVSSTGLVTAIKSGRFEITATPTSENSKTTKTTLSVNPVKIVLDLKSAVLDIGATQQVTATASVGSVTWSSDNPSVATVTSNGSITAVFTGSAKITATSTIDNTKFAVCKVKVNAIKITLDPKSVTLSAGSTKQVTATATVGGVTWSSSDPSIATVSSSGLITAIKRGGASIIATSTIDSSKTVKCSVKVTGTSTMTPTPTPIKTILSNVKSISSSGYRTVLLMNDGTVLTFGAGDCGVLGLGSSTQKNVPTLITGLSEVKDISTAFYHTVILMNDGTVKVFGKNEYGELGLGDNANRNTPTTILGISNVKAISAGHSHSLLLMGDGTVKVFGNNEYGQLGLGDTVSRSTPTTIPGITNVKAISARGAITVLLMGDGTVKVCGNNYYGDLGLGDTVSRSTPTTIPGISGVINVEGSFLLLDDGTVKVFGYNGFGALGLGDTVSTSTPTTILGLYNVKTISYNGTNTLFLINDGSVKGCGDNRYAQLGTGLSDTDNKTSPITIPYTSNVKSVSTGHYFSTFLMNDGTVKVCGLNRCGQLGLGDTVDRYRLTTLTY